MRLTMECEGNGTMPNVKGITIELGFDDKAKLKLLAITKHGEALADEWMRLMQ